MLIKRVFKMEINGHCWKNMYAGRFQLLVFDLNLAKEKKITHFDETNAKEKLGMINATLSFLQSPP